jgi:hypothetical protein
MKRHMLVALLCVSAGAMSVSRPAQAFVRIQESVPAVLGAPWSYDWNDWRHSWGAVMNDNVYDRSWTVPVPLGDSVEYVVLTARVRGSWFDGTSAQAVVVKDATYCHIGSIKHSDEIDWKTLGLGGFWVDVDESVYVNFVVPQSGMAGSVHWEYYED